MPFVRSLVFPVLACLVLPLAAQSPLDGPLRQARKLGLPWILVHRPEDTAPFAALNDDTLARLQVEGDLGRFPLSPQAAKDRWESRNWGKQSRWLLLSASGVEAGDGAGPPSGEQVLAMLRQRGLVPRWEQRRAFLKEHPEHGEAWSEAVTKAGALANRRLRARVAQGTAVRGTQQYQGMTLSAMTLTQKEPELLERESDELFGELATAQAGVATLADWWQESANNVWLTIMGGAGSASPQLRGVCATLAAELEQTLGRIGPEFQAEMALVEYRRVAGRPLRALPETAQVPGEVVLPFALLTACGSTLAAEEDWGGVLALVDSLPPWDSRESHTPASWKGWCYAQSLVSLLRVRPLFELGRVEEARKALDEVRVWSGADWPRAMAGNYLLGAKLAQEKFCQDALKAPALPDPPMPVQQPPLRLVLLGAPSWRADWDRVRQGEALLPWGPAELQWTTLPPELLAALTKRMGWGPEPRWALLRGDDPVASGLQCPAPAALAALLGQQGPTLLERLGLFLERHPEHLGARRARFALLAARMPEPRLESLLAEDARAAFTGPAYGPHPLSFGPEAPWKPDASLWQWSAQQVLPKVETLLRSWPSRESYWKAWLAWARFHPSRPSVVAFADTLTLWQPKAKWLGSLPLSVHAAAARELREAHNYGELARWLGLAWDGLDKTPASEVDPGYWEYLKKERALLESALVAPLADALRLLGRAAEAKVLEATYQTMMNRVSGPPPADSRRR